MAEKDLNARGIGAEETPPSDWQKAIEYATENPRTVLAAVGFVLLCALLGGVYSLYASVKNQHANTKYAAAASEDDAATRVEELSKIASGDNRWSVEALYLAGESAIEAKEYDKARENLAAVVQQHGDSAYAPQAAEALAFLDENDGKLEEALAGYTKVFETWDDTFTGRRQPVNMARVQEELGKLPEAIASYQKQVEVFPESSVAQSAEQALARLESENPELFPEEPVAEVPADGVPAGNAALLTPSVVEAPAAETPVAEAPAAEVPAAEAPAAETPVAEVPAAEVPATEVPATEVPATEVPAGSN